MESAGTEPFSAHKSLFQAADGCARGHAFLFGSVLYPAFLLPMGGRDTDVRLVAAIDVAD